MKRRHAAAALGLALMFASLPGACAAGPAERSSASGDGVSWHHEMQARVLRDMSAVMSAMAERMAGARIEPAESARMAGRMRRMGDMMRLLEEWERSPGSRDGRPSREAMERMRLEMQEMQRGMELRNDRRP